MGTSALSIALTAALVLAGRTAHAQGQDPCMHTDARGRAFPVCFDPGNRLLLGASTAGYGGEIRVRHPLPIEPGLWWRLEHRMLAAVASDARLRGVLYEGRYLRHARDGHIVLPFRPTSKIFVPFDVGVEAEVGRVDWRHAEDELDLGAVRVALLFELTRTGHVRRRLAVGTVARWRMRLGEDMATIIDHRVAPFSRALLDAYLESRDGLSLAGLRIEAGTEWSRQTRWHEDITAEATLERVLIAINDRPLSLHLTGGYEGSRTGDVEGRARGWHGEIGLRFALVQRASSGASDPRRGTDPGR